MNGVMSKTRLAEKRYRDKLKRYKKIKLKKHNKQNQKNWNE